MSVFREEPLWWVSNKKTNLPSRYDYFTMSGRIHLTIQEPPHPLRNAACGPYLASSLQAALLLWGENYFLFCFFPKAAAFQYILINPCESCIIPGRCVWVVPTKIGPYLPTEVSCFCCACLMVSETFVVCLCASTRVAGLWWGPMEAGCHNINSNISN